MNEEIPKHLKKRNKKAYKIKWHYKGELPKMNKLQALFFFPCERKYHSEKAAKQAIKDWREGRGGWQSHYSPDMWEPEIVER